MLSGLMTVRYKAARQPFSHWLSKFQSWLANKSPVLCIIAAVSALKYHFQEATHFLKLTRNSGLHLYLGRSFTLQ